MNKHIKKIAASLTLAWAATFSVAATGLAADAQDDEVTYWKSDFFNIVFALKKCPDSGVCAKIHWLDPKNKKIYRYMAENDNAFPSKDEVRALCGFSPRTEFKKVSDSRWKGFIDMRGLGIKLNTEVTVLNDKEMRVVGSKLLFSQEDTWRRVDGNDPRYPECTPPDFKK